MYSLPQCPATLDDRIYLLQITDKAFPEHQQVREAVLGKARGDVEWWIDYFVDTFDPRPEGPGAVKDLPMLLYPFQRRMVNSIVYHRSTRRDLAWLKSRTQGATWIVVAYIVHRWLFEEGFTALIGSITEAEVDNRTPKSIFGKVDYLIRALPEWMKDALIPGYTIGVHRKKLIIQHPTKPTNVLEGDQQTPEFSRSGRYSMVFMDEAASWTYLDEAWGTTAEAAPFRILVSTPKGKNKFWEIYESDMVDSEFYHWSEHPEKDQAWYEEQCRRNDREWIAQELDCSFEKSASGVVYPDWQETVKKGEYPYQKDWPLYLSIDFGFQDETAIVAWQRDPESGRVRAIDCFQKAGHTIDWWVPFLTGELKAQHRDQYDTDEVRWISRRSQWGPAVIYGDHAGKQRSQVDGRSVIGTLEAEYGIIVVTNPSARDFATRMRLTELGLRTTDVNLPACAALDKAMSNYRYKPMRESSAPDAARPLHDSNSHLATAVEYFFVNLPPLHTRTTRRPASRHRTAAWETLHMRK